MRTFRRAVLASIAGTALLLGPGVVPARAATPLSLILSTPVGLSGGGNKVVGSVVATTANPVPFVVNKVPVVQFQYNTCSVRARSVAQIATSNGYLSAGTVQVNPADVARITGTKITFKVPSASYPTTDNNGLTSTINTTGLVLGTGLTTAKWNVCVYDSDSLTASNLIASGIYTVVEKPTISAVTPTSTPAAGGKTITVTGTGFTTVTTPLTGAIGGSALTNVKIAADGKSFTATTAAHAPGDDFEMVLNTPGGTVSSLDPDNDNNPADDTDITIDYTNGITVTPTTAPAATTATLDITGAGFSGLSFDPGSPSNSSNAHVFLVNGAYEATSNRGAAECTGAVALTDTEIVCTLDLTGVPEGAYIVTVVANGGVGSGSANPSIVSSGAVFAVAPY
ncbi:IPT/TIG domain-containing protein [Actinoplanes sp. NPDC020271]|uniref:IPT/TIG domain-containing protein n=1 Tax=Actinoplanes sp. NPDC020271 TaxID=3363896 RepID=UPI0037B3D87D